VPTEIRTKRDLCKAIDDLIARHDACDRTLESYLLAILGGLVMFSDRPSLTMTEFLGLIESGFTGAPVAFEEQWRHQYDGLSRDDRIYAGCRAEIVRQIVDLREMDESGTLQGEWREFGLDAPRGERWFNFETVGYLGCALAGTFRMREPGDELAYQVESIPPAVRGEAESEEAGRRDDTMRPPLKSPAVSWERFNAFFVCGRIYE